MLPVPGYLRSTADPVDLDIMSYDASIRMYFDPRFGPSGIDVEGRFLRFEADVLTVTGMSTFLLCPIRSHELVVERDFLAYGRDGDALVATSQRISGSPYDLAIQVA